ncbi:SUMO-specific isopeptidase USPL1 isoform X2 [Xenopus laevis]|uniref:SUMO-specific isopeptidase USPL1 isoform X2 n=1 Tax=Xenopus laevis TaxID=8355 RepID=A0A8J1MBX2_XENLA|nr:SUMO-specific isopeptidase USPL1 isoform X2 [Xenopus laevis]
MNKVSQWVTTMASETPGSTVSLVGQGSILDKSSLHTVGCLGKNVDPSTASEGGYCPVCEAKGQLQALRTYRINFTQSIYLCANPQCIYPLGYTPLDNIIANTADLKKRHIPGKQKKRHILDASVTTNCVKKHKTDYSVSGEHILESLVSSPQIESYKSLFPCVPKESHASVPCPLENIQEGRSQQQYVMGDISVGNSTTSPHDDRAPFVEIAQWDSSNQPGHLQKDFNELQKGTVQNQIMGTTIASMDVPSTTKLNVPATKDIYKLSQPVNAINDPQTCINQNTEAQVLNGYTNAEADMGGPLSVLSTFAPPGSSSLMLTALTVGQKQSDITSSSCRGVRVEKAAPEIPLLLNAAMSDCNSENVLPEAASLLETDISETCSKIQDGDNCFGHLPSSTLVRGNPPMEENDLKDRSSPYSKNASFEKVEPEGVPLLEDNKGQALVVSSTSNQLSLINVLDNINAINKSSDSCQPFNEIHLELPMDGNDRTVPYSASKGNAFGNCSNVKSLEQPPLPEVIPMELSKSTSNSQSTCEPQAALIQQCNSSSEQKNEGITLLKLSSSLHSEPTELEDCGNKMGYGSSLSNGEISDLCKTLNDQIHSSPQAVKSLVTDMCNSNLCNSIYLKDGGKIRSEETTVPSCLQLEQSVLYSHTVSNPAVTCLIHGTGPEFKVLDTSEEESGPICKELYVSNVIPDVTPVKGPQDMSQNNVLTDLSNSLSSEITNVEESSVIAANESSLSNGETSPLYHKTSSPTHTEPKANTVCTELCDRVLSNNSVLESSDRINQENAQVTISTHPEQSKLYSLGAETTATPCLSHSAEQPLQISETPGMGCFPVCEEPTVVHDMSNVNPLRASLDTTLGNSDVDFGREKQNESFATDSSLMLTDDSVNDPKNGESVLSLPKGSLEDGRPAVKSNCSENTSSSSMLKALNGALTNHSVENGSQDALCEKKLLQWRNTLFLCWLDCIMSALVHSAGLRSIAAQRESAENSVILHLLKKYKEANALIKSTAKRGRPKNLSLAENILNRVRMTIFEEIKPFLKCELGDKESPVFALPLLLQRDPEVESCFVHSGVWKFTCKLCGYQYQNKCKRTLTTFTKILPEWTPLNAIHRSPCNKCLDTDQRRTFSIEKIHDIFILHFVEGLPSNDLGTYSFQFEGYLYEVRTVIQYREDHFSCWIAKDDGTWLESDDMKGYFCIKQNTFEVPASEIHIVMWERKATNSSGAHNTMAPETEDKALNCLLSSVSQTLHQSAVAAPNAASSPPKETLVASNILSGMEGYRDDDIITLTLIEIPVDASGNVIDNNSEASRQQPSAFVEQLQSPLISPVTLQSVSSYIPTADGQNDHNSCSGTMQGSSFAGVPLQAPSRPSPSRPSPPAPSRPSPPAPSEPSPPAPSEPSFPIISSTPIPNKSSSKKAFFGSWMKSLQNKNPLFLPANVPSANKKAPIRCPLLKTTDLQASNKQAQCFDGFKAKRVSDAIDTNNCHGVVPMKDNFTAPKPALSSQTFQSLGSNRLKNGQIGLAKELAKKVALSKEDKVRRLRLKLLKKLKSKKNELATLNMCGKSQAGSDPSSHPLELSSARRREQLRGFLQELQDQIDNADTESVCTMSSSTSLCSSPGDAEFFAELFSPPPTNTEQDSMEDSRFLEMYVDGYATNTPTSKEVPQSAISIGQSHPQTHASDSHNSSNTGDVFHGMLSTPTMHMLNEEYFSPFDDMF